MGRRDDYRRELSALPGGAWDAYLRERSGLPGPRANLELAQVAADEATPETIDALAGSSDEYLALCGVIGLGRLLAEEGRPAPAERLRGFAGDTRWRVREGVAMAMQRVGDVAPDRLFALAEVWAHDPDPLVRRAAVAGPCEPRLLKPAGAAARAVELCRIATDSLTWPAPGEKQAVRVLRQALGYCWSVAVAADPVAGMPAFLALEKIGHPDVAWVVRENRKKKRLAVHLK